MANGANNAKTKSKDQVRLQDLAFYFDAVERDRQDATGWDRRSGEVLALRSTLLRLSSLEFEVAMKTIKSVVSEATAQVLSEDERAGSTAKRRQAVALFEQVQSGTAGRTSRVDKVGSN